jgi:PBSX family phage terminase large subunit
MQTKTMNDFKKTPKQIEATRLIADKQEVLLEGGSRSGKSFIIIRNIILRALKYPDTRHLIVRFRFNHVKQSIWYGTIQDVMKIAFPNINYTENKSDWFISFDNGSEIWIGGTDDKERIEKILGNEYATIFVNEASQIPYETYETLKTRLNPPKGVPPKLIIDYNPPSKKHWGYRIFHEQKNPETDAPLRHQERYGYLRMNPVDNTENLNENYLETLESLGEKRRRRFYLGEYSDDTEGALWKRDWIIRHRVESVSDLTRVVVAVDPAVTGNETSDDTGIIVVGSKTIDGKEHYYVIDDFTYHGDVTGWGQSVIDAYRRHSADLVVAETNQGGDLVEMNIRNYDRSIRFKKVTATRGKALRAEPIANLYDMGLVHHVGNFLELEDELCMWTPEDKESPNRLDALVWGITYLSGRGSGVMTISRW